jgi:hypothetical protein
MAATPTTSFPCSPTRRRILGWTGIGALAGAAGYLGLPAIRKTESPAPASSAARPRPASSAAQSVADPSGSERFLPHLGSEFQLEAPSLSAVCRLVEVSGTEITDAPTARYATYSLLFAAPQDFPAESRIYRVTHAHMETMELFLSPVGRSDERIHLEVVLSQRV